MNFRAFHLSAQGAAHIQRDKECQDSSDSFFSDTCAIAIVCDGHGGDDYVRSADGSAFACAAAKDNILRFIQTVDLGKLLHSPDLLLRQLCASIIGSWNEKIHDHYNSHPFTESETAVLSARAREKYVQEQRIESAYGTTLIAVAVTPSYWFGLHIGDGKCVAVDRSGTFSQPIPWDERCFLNVTTSICDSDAIDRFRVFFSEELPAAVFIGSDGIDDCFNSDQQLYNLYKTTLYSFSVTKFDEAVSDLRDYLPRLSEKGSRDDVSIAALLDLDRIGELEVVKTFAGEIERARAEKPAPPAAAKTEQAQQEADPAPTELLQEEAPAPAPPPSPQADTSVITVKDEAEQHE